MSRCSINQYLSCIISSYFKPILLLTFIHLKAIVPLRNFFFFCLREHIVCLHPNSEVFNPTFCPVWRVNVKTMSNMISNWQLNNKTFTRHCLTLNKHKQTTLIKKYFFNIKQTKKSDIRIMTTFERSSDFEIVTFDAAVFAESVRTSVAEQVP